MISVRLATIIAVAAFAAGGFVMSPVPAAIAAVIATDVQCTGCVGTSDLAGNAVTAAKIKDGEVKAAEIATDAVGAAELVGITKLTYAQCVVNSSVGFTVISPYDFRTMDCMVNGVDSDDSVIATTNSGSNCFAAQRASPGTGVVHVDIWNHCAVDDYIGAGARIGLTIFDK